MMNRAHILVAVIGCFSLMTTFAAEGFYRVERQEGRWRMIRPDGRAETVFGVSHVDYAPGNVARLKSWGFTNLGGDRRLYHQGLSHTEFLGFDGVCYQSDADRFIRKATGGPMTAMPNMFHPAFAAFCDDLAAKRCAPCRDDRDLLGYFLDNELAWWGTGALDEGLFEYVRTLPETHSARKALETFVGGRTATHAVKLGFLALAAERYFAITTQAVRRHDPNHLILGCRFAGMEGAHETVWRVAAKYCDVVSFNIYPFADLERQSVCCGLGERTMTEVFDYYGRLTGKPLFISEWSFPAMDTGRLCRWGAGQRLPTQTERVAAVELFVKTMLASPWVVGYDFYKWKDQPADGGKAANPEDCNYGVVRESGEPYAALCATFANLHARADELMNEKAPERRVAFVRKGKAWTLTNAAGMRLEGRIGGQVIESVSCNGYRYGQFDGMLEIYHEHTWLETRETTKVSFARKGDAGVLTVRALTNESQGRRCEVTFRFTLRPTAREIEVEGMSVRNVSDRRIRFVSLYMAPRSPGRPQTAENEVLTRDHTPRAAYWRFPDGHRWGLRSDDPALAGIAFTLDANGWPHPDARFVVRTPTYLAPDEGYAPPSPWRGTLVLE